METCNFLSDCATDDYAKFPIYSPCANVARYVSICRASATTSRRLTHNTVEYQTKSNFVRAGHFVKVISTDSFSDERTVRTRK
jgi:hypothetical protein